jgi:hypothetical protein
MTITLQEAYFAEKIKDFLEKNKLQFLMYVGGAGGEFIAIQLGKYSPMFTEIDYYVTENLNRYHVNIPNVLSSIVFNRVPDTSLEAFYLNSARILLNRGMTDIDTELENIRPFVENKNPLIRTHLSKSQFFNKNNTFFMHPDNQTVFDYLSYLRFAKVHNNSITIDRARELHNIYKSTLAASESLPTFDTIAHLLSAFDWLESNGVTEILEIYNDALNRQYIARDVNYNFKSFFDLTPVEIIEKYKDRMIGTYENKVKYMAGNTDRLITLPMSKFFKAGYLEETFQITDPAFREEFTKWHLRNLKLLNEFDIDTTRFNFHL